MPYREGQPAPEGYTLQESVRKGPVIAGAITLGVPYLLGLLIASAANFGNEGGYLVIPTIGPWLTMALREDECGTSDFGCAEDGVVRAYLAIDGVAQGVGTALLIWGLASTSRRYVREDIAGFQWQVTPMQVGSGRGLGIVGQF